MNETMRPRVEITTLVAPSEAVPGLGAVAMSSLSESIDTDTIKDAQAEHGHAKADTLPDEQATLSVVDDATEEKTIDPMYHIDLLNAVAANFLFGGGRFRENILLSGQRSHVVRVNILTDRALGFDDAVQEGYFGLHRACETYNSEYGSFSTHAALNIGGVLSRRAIEYLPVRMPTHAFVDYLRTGEPKPIEVVANETEADYIGYDDLDDSEVRLYADEELMPVVPTEDTVDQQAEDPFDEFEQTTDAAALIEKLIRCTADVKARDRAILEKRFGFYGEPMTLQAIADEYGLTRERIRQIESKLLGKLSATANWLSYLESIKGSR